MKKTSVRLLVTGLLATLLLSLLMVWGEVSPGDVIEVIRGLPPGVYLLALVAHLFTYAMRALRFHLLVPKEHGATYAGMFTVAAAHNFASYLLPAKTGEASLALYMRMHRRIPTAAALASLVVSRLLDGAAMCLALGLACFVLDRSGRHADLDWLGPVSGLLAAAAAVFLVLSLRGDLLLHLVTWPLRAGWLGRSKVAVFLVAKLGSFAIALRTAGGGGRLCLATLVTIPVWIGFFAFDIVLGRAMGLPEGIGFAEITFGASFGSLGNLLPLNAAAGVGTQELGWVTGLHTFLGVSRDATLSAAMGIHIVQVFNIVVLGLIAHAVLGFVPAALRRADAAE